MNKIYEKSSGGIVYRKNKEKIDILLLKWINSKGVIEYVIPKGHMEENETAKQAALREVSEETGLDINDLEIIKFITKLNYSFTALHIKDTPLIDKDVYLFLIKYNGTKEPKVQKEERFVGYLWVSLDEIKNYEIKFDIKNIINKNKVYFL